MPVPLTTVSNVMADATGTPIVGAAVTIELDVSPAGNAFTQAGTLDIDPIDLVTDANGLWTTALIGNSLITPPNSVYQVTERLPGSPPRLNRYPLIVPGDGFSYPVAQLLAAAFVAGGGILQFVPGHHESLNQTITSQVGVLIEAGSTEASYGTRPVAVTNNNPVAGSGLTGAGQILYVGGPDVSTANGFPLNPGDTYSFDAFAGDLYGCVAAASSVDVRTLVGGNS
jgi:hypothetical protein